jgi:hypothetical protein
MKKVSESKGLFMRMGTTREEQSQKEVLRNSHRKSSRGVGVGSGLDGISGGGLHQSWAGG